MTIFLPRNLPAATALEAEGIVCAERRDRTRPGRLQVVLANLMPCKPVTETQFARMLGASRHDVELTLVAPPGHASRNTDPAHLEAFYTPWEEVAAGHVDGLIVTGAPVERIPFAEVDYWAWFGALCDWAEAHAGHSLFVCWAAQAALHHRYGLDKRMLERKAFGVYRHNLHDRHHPLVRGLPQDFAVPVSRHTEVAATAIHGHGELDILASAAETGACLVADRARASSYMFNHLEYDARSLHDEYVRDRTAGDAIALPHDYYRTDILIPPRVARWRPAGVTLFSNWLDLAAARRDAGDGWRKAA